MNRDQAAGGWKELKGKIKQQWGKLTDDDLTVLEGSAQELSGRIQKRYGIAQEEAEKQVDTFRNANNDLVAHYPSNYPLDNMVSVAAGARQIYASFLPWNVAADRRAVNGCAASTGWIAPREPRRSLRS